MAYLNFPVHNAAKLILASQSLVRRAMLFERGIQFSALISPYDEDGQKEQLFLLPPVQQAIILAQGKAHAVSIAHPDAYVIGADQVCEHEGTILGKPMTVERARAHLSMLQGTVHHQHSAACIFKAGVHLWTAVETVRLHMHTLTDEQITDYIRQDEPFSACGAYCYEKTGHTLFSYVEGSADAIKGLPMESLCSALSRLGCLDV